VRRKEKKEKDCSHILYSLVKKRGKKVLKKGRKKETERKKSAMACSRQYSLLFPCVKKGNIPSYFPLFSLLFTVHIFYTATLLFIYLTLNISTHPIHKTTPHNYIHLPLNKQQSSTVGISDYPSPLSLHSQPHPFFITYLPSFSPLSLLFLPLSKDNTTPPPIIPKTHNPHTYTAQ